MKLDCQKGKHKSPGLSVSVQVCLDLSRSIWVRNNWKKGCRKKDTKKVDKPERQSVITGSLKTLHSHRIFGFEKLVGRCYMVLS